MNKILTVWRTSVVNSHHTRWLCGTCYYYITVVVIGIQTINVWKGRCWVTNYFWPFSLWCTCYSSSLSSGSCPSKCSRIYHNILYNITSTLCSIDLVASIEKHRIESRFCISRGCIHSKCPSRWRPSDEIVLGGSCATTVFIVKW